MSSKKHFKREGICRSQIELSNGVIKLVQNTKRLHNGFKILTSDIHLHTAKLEQVPILVFISNELMGNGIIAEVTEEFVKIRGEYYPRVTCTFTSSK